MEHSSGVERAQLVLLLDFYGGCLTEKQRQTAELFYQEDYSLGEIAALLGVTRQAVADSLRKAEQTLLSLEARTGLCARFRRQRELLLRLTALAAPLPGETGDEIRQILRQLRDEM